MLGLGYGIVEVLAGIFLCAGFGAAMIGWIIKSDHVNLFRPNRDQWMVLLASCLFMTGFIFFGVAIGPKAKQAWITQHSVQQTPEARK